MRKLLGLLKTYKRLSEIRQGHLLKLYHGDCFEVSKQFGCIFDTLIFDLPYNIATEGHFSKRKGKLITTKEIWGNDFEDDRSEQKMFRFMRRVAKMSHRLLKPRGNLFLYFDRNKSFFLYPFYLYFKFMNKITFVKTNPVPHYNKNNYLSGTEDCHWFCKGEKPKTFHFLGQSEMKNYFVGNIGRKTIIEIDGKKVDHPTEKYEWMVRPIILRHTSEGELIGDFFMGSGTTGKLSKMMNRSFIGIEKEKKWYEMSVKRIKHASRMKPITSFLKSNSIDQFI